MTLRLFLLYLLLTVFSSKGHAAVLMPDSRMQMLDPAGNLVGNMPFNSGGEYIPGFTLHASGVEGFAYNYTLTGIHSLGIPQPGPGPATDRWLVEYVQQGFSSFTFQTEITLVQTAPNTWETSVLDLDGDGIPGSALIDGPFIGFTPNFTLITAVPVPPALVLFCSGLLGVIALFRRNL